MPPDALKALLNRLPACQRDIARRKVETATKFGWTGIILDPPEGAIAHHYDLIGLTPNGEKRLVPEPSDESTD
jgi:hypothetical protein